MPQCVAGAVDFVARHHKLKNSWEKWFEFRIIVLKRDYNFNFCCHKSFCTFNIASYGSTIGACRNPSFKHSWIFPMPLNTTLDDEASVLALHILFPSLPYILCCQKCCFLYFCTLLNIYFRGQNWSKVNKIIIVTEEAGVVGCTFTC